MDAETRRIIEERQREQREREIEQEMKRPKCETCGEWLLGGRAQLPPGARICGPCERKKR